MSNFKCESIAGELASVLAVRTGLASDWVYVAGLPTVRVGNIAAGGGGGSIVIQDQYGEVDKGWDALPGFPMANIQPVYTTGVTKIVVESQGQPSVAWTKATGAMTFAAVIATDAFKLAGVTFTAVAGPAASAVEFVVGLDDTATAANAVVKINTHPVVGQLVRATSALGTISLTAVNAGAASNLIPHRSFDATITIAGALEFLAGGTGGAAVGWFKFESVIATDTFTVAGVTFTADGPGVTGFAVGANDLATAVNAAAAVNAHPVAGLVVAAQAVAGDTAATAWVYLRAKTAGPVGNLIDTSDADATITENGAFLVGGAGIDPGTGFVMPLDTVLELLGECGKRGLKLEIWATDIGVAPVGNASATKVAEFYPNEYWPISGLV